MQKYYSLLLILIFTALVTIGCTTNLQTPECGDGIQELGECNPNNTFYCEEDCGTIEESISKKAGQKQAKTLTPNIAEQEELTIIEVSTQQNQFQSTKNNL